MQAWTQTALGSLQIPSYLQGVYTDMGRVCVPNPIPLQAVNTEMATMWIDIGAETEVFCDCNDGR